MFEKILLRLGYVKQSELQDTIEYFQSELKRYSKDMLYLANDKKSLKEEVERLERELSEMISQNNKLQAEFKKCEEFANYKIKQASSLNEKLAKEVEENERLRMKIGSLEAQLKECQKSHRSNRHHRRKKR